MSNVMLFTAADSLVTDEIACLVVHDFARQADDELAGRGMLLLTYCSAGAVALDSESHAA